VFGRQTPGRRAVPVGVGDWGWGAYSEADAIADADALVTATPGVGLVMMAADCTPIVLYDADAQVLACVHAGWRGTTARVVDAALAAMTALGARAERCVAGLGPCVRASRYQVGRDVLEAAEDAFGDLSGIVAPDGTGRWTFDLWSANLRTLLEAGVPPAQTHRCALATGGSEFFSDRAVRPCGRHGAIARLRPVSDLSKDG
jgi:YfiH family protein